MVNEVVAERDWISAHAFYHGDIDRLVGDVVAPLRARFDNENQVTSSFFLRYWDGGPHLRLRVLPAARSERAAVEAAIADAFGGFFERSPAADVLTAADYARMAPRLAAGEGLAEYHTALCANNTLVFSTYRREHDRYGDGASIQAVEHHFAESSTVAEHLIESAAGGRTRLAVATAAIALGWYAAFPDPVELDGKLVAAPGIPSAAEQVWNPQSLAPLVAKMRSLAVDTGSRKPVGPLPRWGRSVAALAGRLRTERAAAKLPAQPLGWTGPGAVRSGPDADPVLTVVDMCIHLLCNRIGVGPVAESALRSAAIAAIADDIRGAGQPMKGAS
ncbi:lantibiotic dehydratase C-terminal domain-containing protein [Nocardia sp. NPDC055053]